MTPKPMTDDQVQSIVKLSIDEAIDFVEAEIAPQRIKASRYFEGKVDIGHEEGRAKVVSTKCRDVVRALKPSIMRIFMRHDRPVEFIPRGPEDVAGAEQATAFARYKFNEQNGFRLLNDAIHDALVKKVGILKAYYDESEEVEVEEYSGLTDDQFALIASDDEVEVMEHTATDDVLDGEPIVLHDAKISRVKRNGDIRIISIPPEDFFIDERAASIEDARVHGHRTEMTVGDLVEMGFDFEEVSNLAGVEHDDAGEKSTRRNFHDDSDDGSADPAMRTITVTEAYMRMDIDGTGVPKMWRFITAGTKHEVLRKERCDESPFAVFEVDPEPHTFFGRSVVDLIMDDQDTATFMLRGLIDNVAATNMPGIEMVDGMVNADDLMNKEIGRIVRVKQPGQLRELVTPFTAGTTLPALQYFDEVVEGKTGVTRASMGLNPDALQSTTAAAVNATIAAATGQAEVIVRHLAEGLRSLFRKIIRLAHQHPDVHRIMRMNGQFVPVDPRSWNIGMDMAINVGLGSGGEEERAFALRETFQTQSGIWSTFGPNNGLVTLTNIRNTLADILALSGIHSADRYYAPMTPDVEAALLEQAQAAQQATASQQLDPGQAFLQAEQMKAQARAQTDMARLQIDQQKAAQDMQLRLLEMARNDDLARDKLDQELLVKAAEVLGRYGQALDVAQIKSLQAVPRAI